MKNNKLFERWWDRNRDHLLDMMLGRTDGVPAEYIWEAGFNASSNAQLLSPSTFEITATPNDDILITFTKDVLIVEGDSIQIVTKGRFPL